MKTKTTKLTLEITKQELAQTFTEWERLYREEPEKYMSEAVKLLKETPETYGDECAPYFLKLLKQVKRKNK